MLQSKHGSPEVRFAHIDRKGIQAIIDKELLLKQEKEKTGADDDLPQDDDDDRARRLGGTRMAMKMVGVTSTPSFRPTISFT